MKLCKLEMMVFPIDHRQTGQLARSERKALKLSQTEVARRMGISTPYLCRLERGDKSWNSRLVKKFNLATGMSAEPVTMPVAVLPQEYTVAGLRESRCSPSLILPDRAMIWALDRLEELQRTSAGPCKDCQPGKICDACYSRLTPAQLDELGDDE